eukprot:5483108-Prymnesium_polylepis.1
MFGGALVGVLGGMFGGALVGEFGGGALGGMFGGALVGEFGGGVPGGVLRGVLRVAPSGFLALLALGIACGAWGGYAYVARAACARGYAGRAGPPLAGGISGAVPLIAWLAGMAAAAWCLVPHAADQTLAGKPLRGCGVVSWHLPSWTCHLFERALTEARVSLASPRYVQLYLGQPVTSSRSACRVTSPRSACAVWYVSWESFTRVALPS